MPTADKITAHYARIGRKGGRAKSPAKSHAARLAALARWGDSGTASIPASELKDRQWYGGKGRNADLALWDARNKTFWVTCINDFISPLDYPRPGTRSVRLKGEKHYDDGGTFRPLREIR